MKQIFRYIGKMFKPEQPECLQTTLSDHSVAYDEFTEHPGIDRHLKVKLENPDRYDAGIVGFRLDSVQDPESKEERTKLSGRVITHDRAFGDRAPQFHSVDLVLN